MGRTTYGVALLALTLAVGCRDDDDIAAADDVGASEGAATRGTDASTSGGGSGGSGPSTSEGGDSGGSDETGEGPPSSDPPEPPPPAGDGPFGCPTVTAPPYTGNRGAPEDWSEDERAEVYARGIDAWRRPDPLGHSCADCHGLDGLDLAVLGYSDDDLRRRGADHVDDDDVEAVVDLVHGLRQTFDVTTPCDITWRVFQPGGDVIEGETAIEREHAFGRMLEGMEVLVVSETFIEDTNQAYEAYQQLVDIDVRRVPVPMPLPRWSDDHNRGEEFRNINDWITDEGVTPQDEYREAWYRLNDAYLDDPTEENLFAIVEAMPDMMIPLPLREHQTITRFLNRLNEERYLTALHANHFLRMELLGEEGWEDYGPVAYDLRNEHRYKSSGDHSQLNGFNPFSYLVGVSPLSGTVCDDGEWPDGNVPISCLDPLPDGMSEELSTVESIWDEEGFGNYSPTWGVLGWLYDVSMMSTRRHSNNMKYWRSDMRRRDYDLLLMWMRATALVHKFDVLPSSRGDGWTVPEGLDPTARILDGRWWRHYLVTDYPRLIQGEDQVGTLEERNAMVWRTSMNMHVMVLRIMEDLLDQGEAVNVPDELLSEYDEALEFVLEYPMSETQRAEVEALGGRVRDKVLAAESFDIVTVY